MKLALVVQRYGASVNGGAELHARYIAEMLARHHKVEALTTCASDYVTWRNELPAGTETLRGVTVRRFPVSRERDPQQFGQHSRLVFERRHSLNDELAWLEAEGPNSPDLLEYIRTHADDYDYWIFFSYRYHHAYHGARAVAHKAILVPTAERDAAMGLSLFGPLFRGVRAVMYNSHEERAMIRAAAHNDAVPGVIVGVGSDVPRATSAERFRQKYGVQGPFVIYVGRIDENKGCRELFQFFNAYRPSLGQRLQLLLIGNSILPIPNHPCIRHLGYVSDQDKFDAIAASDALMMPSYYESLSMVALEAWALGRPVLANGRCDVLRGQCIRSRAGLYYENLQEFCETLFTLTTHRPLNDALGENGRRFYEQNYAWPVVERKYLDMLKRLASDEPSRTRGAAPDAARMEPLPGWLTRRRRSLAPALTVLETLPKGAALDDQDRSSNAPGAAGATGTDAAYAASSSASTASASPSSASIASAGSSWTTGSSASSSHGATRRERDDVSAAGAAGASAPDPSASAPSSAQRASAAASVSSRDRAGRGGREGREGREGRDTRESRGERPAREGRDREGRAEGRTRENRDDESRGAKDTRDRGDRGDRRGGGRTARGDRDANGPRPSGEAGDRREPRDAREPRTARESGTDAGTSSDRRAPRESGDAREGGAPGASGERRGRERRGRDRDRDRDHDRRTPRDPGAAPPQGQDARIDAAPRTDDAPRESADGSDQSESGASRDEARRSSAGHRGRGPRGRGRSGRRSGGPGSGGSGSGGTGSQGGQS